MTKTIIAIIASLLTISIFLGKRYFGKRAIKKKMIEETDMSDPSAVTKAFDKLIILLVFALLLSGCTGQTVLHPIYETDIQRLVKDQEFVAPKDGYFFSDMYVKEVMNTKVD